jgi:ribosomal protein S18 acetylase RimI-like enzyme
MNGISVRRVQLTDVDQLLPLMEAYWQHEGIVGFDVVRLRHQLDYFLSSPTYGCAWLAERIGTAVGYLLCTFVYSFEQGGVMAEIDELFVGAPWRRQGVDQGLLAAARAGLAERDCVSLQMQVGDDNVRVQRFYARLGFREKRGYRLWVGPLRAPGLPDGESA